MIEVFNKVNERIVKGIMFHEQMADYFDFLNLHGLKRWQENRFIEESAEMRGLHRFAINHLHRLVNEDNISSQQIIPSSWYSSTQFDVDSNAIKQSVKDAFQKWYMWEKETKDIYEKQFKILTDNGKIAEANKINDLIQNVDKELKFVCRKMLEYKSVDYDVAYIMYQQDEMHSKYEKEVEEIYKIKMC